MEHAMRRTLLANTDGVSCADCEALQHPAVIASDWIGFICLFGSSFILVTKLMSFKGPDQDDKYYMGSLWPLCLRRAHARTMHCC